MDDRDLLALNAFEEAGDQGPDGIAAVCRVVVNRQRLRWFSDGTVAGTVIGYARSDGKLIDDQFSWAWFDFVDGVYQRVCSTLAEATARADALLAKAQNDLIWSDCLQIVDRVQAGTYASPTYSALTDETVLYLNPKIVKVWPPWATAAAYECSIGAHDFYRGT